MKIKLQHGGVKDGEFYVTEEEIEVGRPARQTAFGHSFAHYDG